MLVLCEVIITFALLYLTIEFHLRCVFSSCFQVPSCIWTRPLFSTMSECGTVKTTYTYVLFLSSTCPCINPLLLYSCFMRVENKKLEGRRREDPYPSFPGGKVPGGKERREASGGSQSQTGKPNPDPSHSLRKWGTAGRWEKKDRETSQGVSQQHIYRLIFTPVVSHCSIIYLYFLLSINAECLTIAVYTSLTDLCGQYLDSCESLLWHPQTVRPRRHQVVPGEVAGNSAASRLCDRWELTPANRCYKDNAQYVTTSSNNVIQKHTSHIPPEGCLGVIFS